MTSKGVPVQPYHNIDLMWEVESTVKDKRMKSMEGGRTARTCGQHLHPHFN